MVILTFLGQIIKLQFCSREVLHNLADSYPEQLGLSDLLIAIPRDFSPS